jgi:nitric oxide reductase subunit B
VAAGLFLAPMIARREPRGREALADGPLGALAVVVFGTLIGSYLGIHGVVGGATNWLGLQGCSGPRDPTTLRQPLASGS